MDQKLVAKIKAVKSVQKLSELAHKEGIGLNDEDASRLYAEYHSGDKELSEAELSNVSGGSCESAETLASKYRSVPSDGLCPSFEWSYWFCGYTEREKKICKNCHYCSTSGDYGSFFCTLRKAS
jgi:bacteriocin-like protein